MDDCNRRCKDANKKKHTQHRPPACLINAQTAVLSPAYIRDLRSQPATDRVVYFKRAEVHEGWLERRHKLNIHLTTFKYY